MARMPLKTSAVVLTALSAFGFVLDEHRLEDRTPVYAIDREMDGRLTAYVPLVRAAMMIDRTSEAHLRALAEQWREGRATGTLRPPMPARYGDGDSGRTELVTEALLISNVIATRARWEPDRERSLRLFAASTEPLRTVHYADLATMQKIETRRSWLKRVMRERGFAPEQVARTTGALRPEPKKMAELLRHLSRLRNQFRIRFEDDEDLARADPFFEALVRGSVKPRFFVRS